MNNSFAPTIGVDMIRCHRFTSFFTHPHRLPQIFSTYECEQFFQRFSLPAPSPAALSFLASRFAAKEAFYKAMSQLLVHQQQTNHSFSLRACAPALTVSTNGTWGVPQLIFDSALFFTRTGITLLPFSSSLSLTHDGEYAIATVLLFPSPR